MFVSRLLKVSPFISFGITKHFEDVYNNIKVFCFHPPIDVRHEATCATKTLHTSLDIYISSREIMYQALVIVWNDRNGQAVVLNEDILSNQA